MKNILIALLILSSVVLAKAQLNGGFEDWVTEISYEVPDKWQTLNFLTLTSPPNPLSVSKATLLDKHSGNYAMKIKTIFVNNNPYPQAIVDSMGGVFTGKINLSPFSYNYGFPYTGFPEKLKFWTKYSPVGNDTAVAGVVLQRWNSVNVKRDTLAIGTVDIVSLSDYNLYEITINYLMPGVMPDSAAIFFGSSKTPQGRVGSTLYVDDVSFAGWVGIDELNSNSSQVSVFPNPAKDIININTTIETAETVRIFDLSGRLVITYKLQNKTAAINATILSAGLCFYDIIDKKGSVLAKGRFEVIK
ncbi:MAG: T9SS type A sorting domain-containing protein [Bacteroidota bacterium]